MFVMLPERVPLPETEADFHSWDAAHMHEGVGVLVNMPFGQEVKYGDVVRFRGGTHQNKPVFAGKVEGEPSALVDSKWLPFTT